MSKTTGSTDAVNYRLATQHDVDALVELINAAYRPAAGAAGWTHEAALVDGARIGPVQLLETLQAQDSVLIVAATRGALAGCIEVRANDDTAYIGTLAVSPSAQDRGLGKGLLNEAEQFASRRWHLAKAVMTVLSARRELIDFYLRRGYVRTGHVTGYPINAGVGIPRDAGLTIETLTKSIQPD
ncbi:MULTISPECIES: GNAT family N-acetyltransferase [Burkholderia]|uniref:GNAT family N-acetyltransferase n=1 Tax=Burkholderia anthina TaxID=179879 RepID=A0A7T7AL62_9BURK|nr:MULTISPECIES: GNAT family N-acetyltransferase [Burkholderia]MBY4870142.1 GNAT family N-acetyltransferase [Burkholderia anthina]QQK06297.1 GNAT family N-acetyltransferase [Burkholderia anthina]